MKINFFKQRESKRFNYTPRYYNGKSSVNNYEFGSRINKYRDTYNSNDLSSKWKDARKANRKRSNRGASKTLILIILVLVFIFLYIIDFDLSIFNVSKTT